MRRMLGGPQKRGICVTHVACVMLCPGIYQDESCPLRSGTVPTEEGTPDCTQTIPPNLRLISHVKRPGKYTPTSLCSWYSKKHSSFHFKMKCVCRRAIDWGAFDRAKNHKRQRRKRHSVTAKREKSQTPKFV